MNAVAVVLQTVSKLNAAIGNGFTTVLRVMESRQPKVFCVTSVTGYVPGAVYVCVGFCTVLAGLPSPKCHVHCVGALVVASVNTVVTFRQGDVDVKFGTVNV